jgi:hypothetical protein
MIHLKRALWGYNIKEVNKYIRKFKSLSELEIDYLQQLIETARKELTLLSHGSRPFHSIQDYTIAETSTAIAEDILLAEFEEVDLIEEVEVEVEVEEEVIEFSEKLEQIEEDVVLFKEIQVVEEAMEESKEEPKEEPKEESKEESMEEAALVTPTASSAGMGRLLMFRRKLDTLLIQNDPISSEPSSINEIESYGYWDSIDHYLQTPVITEDLLKEQTDFVHASYQSQISSSAVGLPRYFDYNLSEPQIQTNLESQVMERRVKGKLQEALPAIKLNKSKENADSGTNKILPNPEGPSVTQGSKEITREVRQLRYKYIVGKWAGEDLHDDQNQIIVRKNNVITEEIVDTAEREGKLSLLIIHMIIPGLGEDI